MLDPAAARAVLAPVGQEHLLTFFHDLTPAEQNHLLAQIAQLDLAGLAMLVERYVTGQSQTHLPSDLEPARYYPRDPGHPGHPWDARRFHDAGASLLAAGKVACFTVAGGQGSRLGYEGPKGCYPTGCVTAKPLFQIFAEGILATERTYGGPVPWYIMTSPLNHHQTVAFFEQHEYFGLDRARVMFFPQGTMPSFDLATGRILLSGKGEIATNPDGHGGALKALVVSGATADMRRRGVEHLSYFQVDNPHVRVADPVFLGLHATAPDSSAEMSSKMLPKAEPKEKVGAFCRSHGRTCVIEYSDMPDRLSSAVNADGTLKFNAGSIAVHALSVEFVDRVVSDPTCELPYHRAIKKVPFVDLATGARVDPAEPNAVKLERFVFDAIPVARNSIIYETDRVEEFAPVKNKDGVDSIISCKHLQTERAARWLKAAGVDVPRTSDGKPDCVIEISPLTALSADQLRQRGALPRIIERGAKLAL